MQHAEVSWFVAVGASGGEGLNDIKELLGALPVSLAATVLIVLHRPWDTISQLRVVLDRASSMPVLIARDGERFMSGVVLSGSLDDGSGGLAAIHHARWTHNDGHAQRPALQGDAGERDRL